MRNSKQKLFEVLDIEDDVVEMQYGGGLSNAYSTLADRRQNMYGMGESPSQMSSVFQDPLESSAFSPVNMEQGGDIVVPQERMINNQPHQLSYINPEEAGLLKALGGSGRRVDGIPAYFSGEAGTEMDDDIGESFSGGDFSGSDFNEFDQADADAGAAGITTPEGKDPVDDYISYDQYGRGIQSGSLADEALNQQNLAAAFRAGGQDYRDRFDRGELGKIDPDSKLSNLQLAQRGIDRGLFEKAGIPIANFLEQKGLATFGKGMRGPLEARTPGDALYRNKEDIPQDSKRGEYDPEALIGNADLSDNPNKAAIQAFNSGLRFSKSGDTVADVTQSMRDSGRFSDAEISNAAQTMGYSSNSLAQASQVYDSLNDSRIAGALKGGLTMLGGALSPTSIITGMTQSYGDKGETRDAFSDVKDVLGNLTSKATNTLGVDVSKLGDALAIINNAPGFLADQIDLKSKNVSNRNEDMTSVINPEVNQDIVNAIRDRMKEATRDDISLTDLNLSKAQEFNKTGAVREAPRDDISPNTLIDDIISYRSQFINDPSRTLGQFEDQRNIGKAGSGGRTPTNRNIDPSPVEISDAPVVAKAEEVANAIKNDTPLIEAPEQNIFEKGISALVNLFGGPKAAFRNNIDTSFDSGNDQPERRVAPPKIPEVLSAAIEQAEPIPVEDSGLSARELSLGPQVNTLILQGVDPSTAIRQVGIDQGEFTVAQILKLLGVS
jgi:hypothetical protein